MLERAGKVALLGLPGVWVSQQVQAAVEVGEWCLPLGMGLQRIEEPYVMVEERGRGDLPRAIQGDLRVAPGWDVTFYERMLIIFLGLLEMPEETRGSRRFWHWLEQDWGRMLSQRCGVVLLEEVRQRVIDS